jgi:hypothetical protein
MDSKISARGALSLEDLSEPDFSLLVKKQVLNKKRKNNQLK